MVDASVFPLTQSKHITVPHGTHHGKNSREALTERVRGGCSVLPCWPSDDYAGFMPPSNRLCWLPSDSTVMWGPATRTLSSERHFNVPRRRRSWRSLRQPAGSRLMGGSLPPAAVHEATSAVTLPLRERRRRAGGVRATLLARGAASSQKSLRFFCEARNLRAGRWRVEPSIAPKHYTEAAVVAYRSIASFSLASHTNAALRAKRTVRDLGRPLSPPCLKSHRRRPALTAASHTSLPSKTASSPRKRSQLRRVGCRRSRHDCRADRRKVHARLGSRDWGVGAGV